MKKKAKFSKWGFILASVGSAVGMANVWGFPNKLGSNGGGSFLFAYIFFIVVFSCLGLPAEFAIGRRAGTGTLGAYRHAFETRNKKLSIPGRIIGWIPLAGSMCIAIGYSVIIAYVLKAFMHSIDGTIISTDTSTWFESFSMMEHSVIYYHIAIVALTLITLYLGAKGIEKTNKIMMPLFFIIFVILAIRVFFLKGSDEGYWFMFFPRLEYLKDPMVWVWAMGQAFFSLSITGSGMIVYGSYLDENENVISISKKTAFFDTLAAMVASLVIIPACFSYNFKVDAGPSLLFVTLPKILQNIPFGNIFAIILYLAMLFAGISSLQNMFEAVVESINHKFPKLNRKIILLIIGIICLGFGLNMEAIYQWGPWMDFVSIYIIPIGASLGAITWFWVMNKDDLLNEINKGCTHKYGNIWYWFGRFFYVPIAVILCLIAIFNKISF